MTKIQRSDQSRRTFVDVAKIPTMDYWLHMLTRHRTYWIPKNQFQEVLSEQEHCGKRINFDE